MCYFRASDGLAWRRSLDLNNGKERPRLDSPSCFFVIPFLDPASACWLSGLPARTPISPLHISSIRATVDAWLALLARLPARICGNLPETLTCLPKTERGDQEKKTARDGGVKNDLECSESALDCTVCHSRVRLGSSQSSKWAVRDSNPRHPPCKGGALAN